MAPEVIRGILHEVLRTGLVRIACANGAARIFARDPARLPKHLLVRHLIEHVFRIRLFRPLDARAIQLLSDIVPDVAVVWGRYARSEAVHDRYFLRDLEAIGLDREAVEATLPFPSTVGLVRFVEGAMRLCGPLPVVLYSFWAEENSDIGSARIVDRTRTVFGSKAVRGASAHRALDKNLDHTGVIAAVLEATIRDDDELQVAAELLDTITEFIGSYFADLDAWRRRAVSSAWAPRGTDIRMPVSP